MDELLTEIATAKMLRDYNGKNLQDVVDAVRAEYERRYGNKVTHGEAYAACCEAGANNDLPAPTDS